tara:strand:- start:4049 stop:7138 length:3090 start_codon:yes stop_codon:yes gene_type:complete
MSCNKIKMKKILFFKNYILIFGVLLLSACINTTKNTEDIDVISHLDSAINRGPTLAELNLQPSILTRVPLTALSFEQLSNIYLALLNEVEDSSIQDKIKKRLAVLSMLESEQAQINAVKNPSHSYQQSIATIKQLLANNPDAATKEQLLYQLAKAYDLTGEQGQTLAVIEELIETYPSSIYLLELHFRRAEILFSNQQYNQALPSYKYVIESNKAQAYLTIALYMQGWSYFKLDEYEQSLATFSQILDKTLSPELLMSVNGREDFLNKLPASDREMVNETFVVMSVIFSNLYDIKSIENHYKNIGARPYSFLSFDFLAQLYLSKQRFSDSYDVYHEFVNRYSEHRVTPVFALNKLHVLKAANFPSRLAGEQEEFVAIYQPNSSFWFDKAGQNESIVRPVVYALMQSFAQKAHLSARQLKNKHSVKGEIKQGHRNKVLSAYGDANSWYKEFITNFPNDKKVIKMRFHLADSLYEAEQYAQAAKHYQLIAYPKIEKSSTAVTLPVETLSADALADETLAAEAGYALILTLDAIDSSALNKEQQQLFIAKQLQAKVMFLGTFDSDQRLLSVRRELVKQYYKIEQYPLAITSAVLALQSSNQQNHKQINFLLSVIADSYYALTNYEDAERYYLRLLEGKLDKKRNTDVVERLAASIYQQAKLQLSLADELLAQYSSKATLPANPLVTSGSNRSIDAEVLSNRKLAIKHFSRLLSKAKSSSLSINAQYELASLYLTTKQWPKAIEALIQFQLRYPEHELNTDIDTKLAYAFQQSEQWQKAANKLRAIWQTQPKTEATRSMLWLAATLSQKANDSKQSLDSYRTYAHAYPLPLTNFVTASLILSDLYLESAQPNKRKYWLKKLIAADADAGEHRTSRSQQLAAKASLEFADNIMLEFEAVKLKLPLSKSLKQKRRLLDKAILAYRKTANYQLAEFTTIANFRTAELYHQVAKDLMASERPEELNALELEQYNILLEEQSFPFEDKAIAIHEVNAKRAYQGTYDKWVKNSFTVLAGLLPGRYNKDEYVVEVIDDIY